MSGRKYILVYGVLLALLALSWAVGVVDLGAFNPAAALSVAFVKTFIIAVCFMHLGRDTKWTVVFAGAGLVWLLLMIALTLSDYLTRTSVSGWE